MTTFNLDKGREAAEERLRGSGFSLLKDDRQAGLKLRVRIVMDGSGSTRHWWLDGTMQEALQVVLPTAIAVDDDGDMPVAVFNDGRSFKLIAQAMTRTNYHTYVKDQIVGPDSIPKVPLWGGTDYSPVLRAVLADEGFVKRAGLFGLGPEAFVPSPNACPTIVYFFTDGECSPEDKFKTRALLGKAQVEGCRAYFVLVGVGPADHSFLKDLARELDNAGFVSVVDLRQMTCSSPDSIARQLLPDEMLAWLKLQERKTVG